MYTPSSHMLERSRSPDHPFTSRRQDANYAMVPSRTPWTSSRGAIDKHDGIRRRGQSDEGRQTEAVIDHTGRKVTHPHDQGMTEDVVVVGSMSSKVVSEVHMNGKRVVREEGTRQEPAHDRHETNDALGAKRAWVMTAEGR
jgi:hypothetical protein